MNPLRHIVLIVLTTVSLTFAAMEKTASIEGEPAAETKLRTSAGVPETSEASKEQRAGSAEADPAILAVVLAGTHRYTVTDKAQILFHTISRSAHTAYQRAPWARPGCHVMRSEKDWTAPGYVDYDHEMLIAVSMGSQDQLAGTIEIVDVKIDENRVQVIYATNLADNPKQARTHPHHLIRLPRADLPVEFRGPELLPPFVAQ
ncbi:MAG: hypothetical protein O2923_09210 [Verrucomicrobia bacterium]|nr:hypothetical protein [Verrucomicrobiota bacterium]MDA1087460.1 hypothetical protein [Verrucomicrobiota bacterium]